MCPSHYDLRSLDLSLTQLDVVYRITCHVCRVFRPNSEFRNPKTNFGPGHRRSDNNTKIELSRANRQAYEIQVVVIETVYRNVEVAGRRLVDKRKIAGKTQTAGGLVVGNDALSLRQRKSNLRGIWIMIQQ